TTAESASPALSKVGEPQKVGQQSTSSARLARHRSVATEARLKSPKVQTRKSPRFTQTIGNVSTVKGSVAKSPSAKMISPKLHGGNISRLLKENKNPARGSIASPGTVSIDKNSSALNTEVLFHNKQKPLNYVPYKGALKAPNRTDVHKAMSEKMPHIKSLKERRDVQQKILKGVRFNRRFELQMAKRGISLN
ncbi:hypothetical protein SK128_022761, partial [Halocaridina rubra]